MSVLLRRFLECYWLRPENAFWMALRSWTLSAHPLNPPTIDLGCGDGIFTFLHAGGTLHPAFDVFTTVGGLDRVHHEHHDMFDHVNDHYRPVITTPPKITIAAGTDVKPAMLAKAARLGLYDCLIHHDHNRPLPWADDAFDTVYCNTAYWVANVDGFLRELYRITRPGGRIILQVKLDSLRRYTLGNHRALLRDRFLDIIGRGRVECWPGLADRATWEARFTASGLAMDDVTPFITRTHAQIWDVGLRPIAPMLVRMANALTPETRAEIKREWVDLFSDLLAPLCNPHFDLFAARDEPAELQYVLRPR